MIAHWHKFWIAVHVSTQKFLCMMDWGHQVHVRGFDGCSVQGYCPACDNHLLKDSQGNWFKVSR